MRWTNKPTAPLLAEVEMAVVASGADNATTFFEDIALGWRDRR
jgi:hypothetical protein